MAITSKGNFFLFSLLLFLCFPSYFVADSSPDVIDNQNKANIPEFAEVLDAIKKQSVEVVKLKQKVEDLADQVSVLISQLSDCSKIKSLISKDTIGVVQKTVEFDSIGEIGEGESDVKKKELMGDLESDFKDVDKGKSVSVTKFSSPFWNERFQFVSAVKLASNPTCIHVLPFRDSEGLSKYIVIGDNFGRLFVVSRNGDVLKELDSVVKSSVTTAVSYLSVFKNESTVISGHVNGGIVMHRVWEELNGDDWNSIRVEKGVEFDTFADVSTVSPVSILEVHQVGRKRYVLSVDLSGKITVFRENGSVYGEALPSSRPLAFSKQRLLYLTEHGAGSLDLRSMKVREVSCDGLNNSVVESYEFDATDRSKAYGVTYEGDLIQVFVLGDTMNFKCRVRSKRKLDLKKPIAFQAIKGYLLTADSEKMSVYNVSSPNYVRSGSPKLVFSTEISRISASLLNQHHILASNYERLSTPVLGSDREKLVILSLGGGYVGTYRSNLSIFKNEFSTLQWTSPVLFFILFLFGAWHFFANKKDALISWGPDDPFSSALSPNGASATSTGSDRSSSLNDSSRNGDAVDMKNTAAIRGPPRRYSSPTRFPGGSSAIPYRPPQTDVNSVATTSVVDSNFRANQDSKFRGTNFENAGFPKRRVFVNNAGVDE